MQCMWMSKSEKESDFPGGPVVKNAPANAGNMVQSLFWEDPHKPWSN